jgi:SAM-dependent methyltransferase
VTVFSDFLRWSGIRRKSAFATYDIAWLEGGSPGADERITGYQRDCPVCGSSRAKTAILRAVRRGIARGRGTEPRIVTLLACPECASRFCENPTPLAYERPGKYSWATDFYVEQGAAIDGLIEPLARLAGRPIDRVLEIGCGYGFSLDAGQRLFGWRTLGVDPSPLAAAGCRDLGVSIKPAYAATDTELGGSFDLVYASEVIEHVGRPDEFLRVCRAHLAVRGVLALTTPDAACVRAETPSATLLPALSLGHHLVLFSARGLELALRRAGFAHVAIWADGPRLIAYAGSEALDFDPGRPLDRKLYRDYLSAVLRRDDLPPSLELGLRSRLLKELTHAGEYANALQFYEQVAAFTARKCGVWLKPDAANALALRVEEGGLSGTSGVPWCLPVIYYCRAMIELNHIGNHGTAVAWFDASSLLAAACRATYVAAGMDDGETAVIELEAKRNALLALSFLDPAAAIERLAEVAAQTAATATWWRTLVIRLLERGEVGFAGSAAARSADPALVTLAGGFVALHRSGDAQAALRAFESLGSQGSEIAQQAMQGALLACAQLEPDRVADTAERGALSAWLIEALFIRLVDLGHTPQAHRLERLLVGRETWQIQSRIGLIRMLESAPAQAVASLAQAFILARQPGSGASNAECGQLKYREVLSRLLIKDADGAAHAAAQLLGAEAAAWVPPQIHADLTALLIDHPEVRAAIENLPNASVGLDGNAG